MTLQFPVNCDPFWISERVAGPYPSVALAQLPNHPPDRFIVGGGGVTTTGVGAVGDDPPPHAASDNATTVMHANFIRPPLVNAYITLGPEW